MNTTADMEGMVNNITGLIFLIVISVSCHAQKHPDDVISKEEYAVINSLMSGAADRKFNLYHTTDFDKDYAVYFEDGNIDLITGKVGVPVRISDEALENILVKDIRMEIISKIYSSKPLRLKRKELHKNYTLNDCYDCPSGLAKNVRRITRPIVIDKLAIIRSIGLLDSSIHILKKEGGKWNIVYTFNDWLILH